MRLDDSSALAACRHVSPRCEGESTPHAKSQPQRCTASNANFLTVKSMTMVAIDKQSLLSVLEDLEFLVVSLDHIGSSDLLPQERAEVVYRFTVEANVFQRLASIRRLLISRADDSLSPSECNEIEEALENISPWNGKQTS